MECLNPRVPTVQQVFNKLSIQYGHRVAESIMDGLEGKPDQYAVLVKLIMEDRLSEFVG